MVETEVFVLAAVVVVAAAARAVALVLRLPPAATYVAAGLLARFVLPTRGQVLETLLILGLTFLLFSAGTRFGDLRPARSLTPQALVLGLALPSVMGGLAIAVASAAGWAWTEAAYAGAAVALSSTLLAVQWLGSRGEIREPHGQLLLAAMLVQDLLAVTLVVLLPVAVSSTTDLARGLAALAAVALVAGGLWWVLKRPAVWKFVSDPEIRTLTAFGVVFLMVLVAYGLGAQPAVGAFAAGLAMSAFPARVRMRPVVRSAREFFTPLLLVTLGVFFPLPGLDELPLLLALLALLVVVKPFVLAFGARWSGVSVHPAAEAGALAAQGSEFALVILVAGAAANHLPPEAVGLLGFAIVASFLLLPLVFPPLLRALLRALPAHPALPIEPPHRIVVLGAGGTGRALIRRLQEGERRVLAVDVDPRALALLPSMPTLQADAREPATLDQIDVAAAEAVVVLVRLDEVALEIAERLRDRGARRVLVRVDAEDAARRLEERGASPLRVGELAAEALERWLDEENFRATAAP